MAYLVLKFECTTLTLILYHLQRSGGGRGAEDDSQEERGGVDGRYHRAGRGKYYCSAALGTVFFVGLETGAPVPGELAVVRSQFIGSSQYSVVAAQPRPLALSGR